MKLFRTGLGNTLLFFFAASNFVLAGKIERGFERLKVYDYFAAKKYFEKSLKEDPAASAFGLSSIYSLNNNPFYNLNEARRYILFADSSYKTTKERTRKFYSSLGVTDSSINSLSDSICENAFHSCRQKGTVEAFDNYLQNFSTCRRYEEAYGLRDSTAFALAGSYYTSESFRDFMSRYPDSKYLGEAQKEYYKCVFLENTYENDLSSYENFIRDYPENPFRPEAEKRIFELSVPDRTLEQYITFVRKYDHRVDTKNAWRELSRLFMENYSMEKYNDFKDSFPDYPFPEEFDEDFKIENYIFLPVYRDGHWGYVNESGREMIKPLYDDASLFSEGLAAVTRNGKTGFINKKGNEIIKLQFNDADPFHNGAAIVIKDSLYGLINKRGEYITPPMYDALTETSGDLYIASNNGSYGYIHKYGKAITPFDYEIAKDFRGGYAVVRKGGLYGLINSTGKFELNPSYKELDFINDTLLKAADTDGMWGIIQVNGDTVVPFMYEAIGDFSENRALVSKGGQCGYIDETGHVIIHLKFNYSPFLLQTASFKNGFALLKQKQKSVLIDSNGKVIKFNGVEDYKLPSFGFVPVQKNKKWGFADFNGKIKIACMYESVEPFDEILTVVKRKNESGLIDTSGVTFIQPLYQEITLIKNAIKVKSDNNWGLLSRRGILYLSCRYSRIDLITPDIVQAKDENGFTYVNLKTGKIIFSASE